MSGLDLIREIRTNYGFQAGFVVVTVHDVGQYREEALRAGACEIVSKGNTPRLLDLVNKELEFESE